MRAAAANLEFEKAASLRDKIKRLRNPELALAAAGPERVTRRAGRSSTVMAEDTPRSRSRSTSA